MKTIKTKNGNIYVVDAPYWAGEHTFAHYANSAVNARFENSDHVNEPFTDLWAVDTYNRTGLNPLQHRERFYIWATTDANDAANEASRFIEGASKVFITHIEPLNDRLREPDWSYS